MKIVCISDTHSMHKSIKELPQGDVLIHAGDFTGHGDPKRVEEFNSWLGEIKSSYKHILVVPGNHELTFEHEPEISHHLITNATLLIDQEIIIDGVKFYGSPWTPFFFNWAFNIHRGHLRRVWDKIPSDTDVLITHGPPHGILDLVPARNAYNGSVDQRVGCEQLRTRVLEVKPKLHAFGHIHEGYGIVNSEEGTTYINASICDGRYKPVNKPIEFHLEKKNV
jgi:Icc-related predicted phosphoesterase